MLGIHEIFFVATADKNTLQYTFELDMVTAAEDFAGLSGSYSIVRMGVWAYELHYKIILLFLGSDYWRFCFGKFVFMGNCKLRTSLSE